MQLYAEDLNRKMRIKMLFLGENETFFLDFAVSPNLIKIVSQFKNCVKIAKFDVFCPRQFFNVVGTYFEQNRSWKTLAKADSFLVIKNLKLKKLENNDFQGPALGDLREIHITDIVQIGQRDSGEIIINLLRSMCRKVIPL